MPTYSPSLWCDTSLTAEHWQSVSESRNNPQLELASESAVRPEFMPSDGRTIDFDFTPTLESSQQVVRSITFLWWWDHGPDRRQVLVWPTVSSHMESWQYTSPLISKSIYWNQLPLQLSLPYRTLSTKRILASASCREFGAAWGKSLTRLENVSHSGLWRSLYGLCLPPTVQFPLKIFLRIQILDPWSILRCTMGTSKVRKRYILTTPKPAWRRCLHAPKIRILLIKLGNARIHYRLKGITQRSLSRIFSTKENDFILMVYY
jgi:hypothetical protein